MHTRRMLATAVVLIAAVFAHAQQDPKQRPSPPATAQATFADGKAVTINYSAPSVRGRKIIGQLVPYGKVWRTGANEATSFETQTAVEIGGTAVPAGKYTLYTIPEQSSWTLIISKQTGQWGTEYNQAQDLARVKMNASSTNTPVEKFTIDLKRAGDKQVTLTMSWENTQATTTIQEK